MLFAWSAMLGIVSASATARRVSEGRGENI